MVAEKFQPLIAAGPAARAGQRGDVRQRAIEKIGVLEAVADALLERAGALAAALARCRGGSSLESVDAPLSVLPETAGAVEPIFFFRLI